MKIGPRPKFLFKLGISLGLVIYLAVSISWRQVWDSLLAAKPGWIALGYLQGVGILYLQAWRWKILLRIPGLTVSKYLHFIYVGMFYRVILPGSLSADMLKVVLFGKKYNKPLHESSVIFFSQFLGLALQGAIGLVGLFYFGAPLLEVIEKAELSWRKLALLGGACAALLFAIPFVPAFRAFLTRLLQAMRTAIGVPGVLARVLWVTLGIQILMIGSAFCIFWGVGVEIPVLFLCFQMALANALVALPISISGLGVVEYLNIFLIQNTFGTPAAQIIAVSVVSYSLMIVNAMIGGAWILWRNLTAGGGTTDRVRPEPTPSDKPRT
ncbi:MAG: flippase-like domain-containing protein [Fibrobacterota bacterium]|nr:flippase-like domain-containing protein [Fibrobacterota bacterium]